MTRESHKRTTMVLLGIWLVIFLIALVSKWRAAFLGLPVVCLILIGYLVYATLVGCKPSVLVEDNNKEKENTTKNEQN